MCRPVHWLFGQFGSKTRRSSEGPTEPVLKTLGSYVSAHLQCLEENQKVMVLMNGEPYRQRYIVTYGLLW